MKTALIAASLIFRLSYFSPAKCLHSMHQKGTHKMHTVTGHVHMQVCYNIPGQVQ